MAKQCQHNQLNFDSSSHVGHTKYKRVDEEKRIAATLPSGRVPEDIAPYRVPQGTFPAPLVLPEDELAWDGKYPPQSLRSFIRGDSRNEVTPDRRTIYLIGPPEMSDDVEYMRTWSQPVKVPDGEPNCTKEKKASGQVSHPETSDLLAYFQAFFHGMDVKNVSQPWRFTAWHSSKANRVQRKSEQEAISLETNDIAIRIRTRDSHDGHFKRQLNLSDLLDACIDSVPKDAYAVLLLVEQDMYEDDDDDFCCGRAFGGSRVAVVSTARYNPVLDEYQGVEREHAWPASHCAAYMKSCCAGGAEPKPKKKRVKVEATEDSTAAVSAIQAAVTTHTSLPSPVTSPSTGTLNGLWLGRVCRTASHEIGHCLGIDHCVYYACLMQGTANVCEDARQPPFLCPVDLAKLTTATGVEVAGRYQALQAFCDKRANVHLFGAFSAWLGLRLADLKALEA
jgi:archaemetzincin